MNAFVFLILKVAVPKVFWHSLIVAEEAKRNNILFIIFTISITDIKNPEIRWSITHFIGMISILSRNLTYYEKKRQSMLVEFMLFFTKPELVHVSCYFEAVIFDDFCRHERLMQEGPR